MSGSNLAFLIIIGVLIVALFGWITFGSKKKQWYIVYLANNDVMLLYRDLNERWWRTSGRYLRFKDEFNREVTFPSDAHWIIKWESIPLAELEVAKKKIERMKASLAESK